MAHDLSKSGPFLGVGGMAVALFLFGYTALALPGVLTVVVLPLVWVALFALSCSWFTRRPRAVVVLPVVAVVLWFGLLLAFAGGS